MKEVKGKNNGKGNNSSNACVLVVIRPDLWLFVDAEEVEGKHERADTSPRVELFVSTKK